MSRVWLITGAGAGLGRAIAEAAVTAGDAVLATARDPRSVADFDAAARVDVTDQGSIDEAVAYAMKRFGRIDVVVNNAGHGLIGATEELADEDLSNLLDVNLFGALRVTRAVLPVMRIQRSGLIIQMSSVGGIVGNPGHAAYATSKFALEGMSEALAGEVADFGIRVMLVEPGPFRTEFAGRSIRHVEPIDAYATGPAGVLRSRFALQDGVQPNDPRRAAAIILDVIDTPRPPLRLPLGPEAIDRIRAKLEMVRDEIDQCEAFTRDTGFAAGERDICSDHGRADS